MSDTNETNLEINNDNPRLITRDEILDTLEKLAEEVINLSDRVKVLLENIGFFV